MRRRPREFRRGSWFHYDGQVLLLAAAIIVILFLLYFFVFPNSQLGEYSKDFWIAITTNLIPTLLVVIVTYLFYSAAQRDRADEDREELINDIEAKILFALKPDLEDIKSTLSIIQESQLMPGDIIDEMRSFSYREQNGSNSISHNRSKRGDNWSPATPATKANSELSRNKESLRNREAG